MTNLHYITPGGAARLRQELDELVKVERPRVVDQVADAAAMGDRSENAEYIYGKRRLREIDRRVRFLGQRLDTAIVVAPPEQKRKDRVYFGAVVDLEDSQGQTKTWQLVGQDEVDAQTGQISYVSPLGAALLGKLLDDEVKVQTPGGVRVYTIIDIR